MDVVTIEVFQNGHSGGTDQKSGSFWPDNLLGDFKVELILSFK